MSLTTDSPLTITTTWLPPCIPEQVFEAILEGQGGQPPYTWTIIGGNDFQCSTAGYITGGNPENQRMVYFTAVLTDASGQSVSKPLQIDENPIL